MKHCLILLFFLLGICSLSMAQQKDIIQDLNMPKSGEGMIVVYQDESIEGLLGSKSSSLKRVEMKSETLSGDEENGARQATGYTQAKGYKIQVFSGNDQRRSKNEAHSRKRVIEERFPEMEVSVIFNSPVWRVRAGNYRTYEDAYAALQELKKAFPSYGREMQIVEARVKLPVY